MAILSRPTPPSTPPPYSAALPRPRCVRCGAGLDALARFITRRSYRNGNADRPYVKCMPCNKFVTFMDDRGVDDAGPRCNCDLPCRLQVSGRVGVATPRGLHYVCSVGQCDHFEIRRNERGEQAVLDEDLIGLFARLRFI